MQASSSFSSSSSSSSKKILITSVRSPVALDLARQFHSAGHEVFTVETMRWHMCRFSNSVKKNFVVPSPRISAEKFIESVIKIVQQEKIDLVVPIYEEIFHLSKERHRFPDHCQIFAPSFETLHELHNKWLFNLKIQSLGLDAPKTFLIKTEEDLKALDPSMSYALKACYSRASLNIKKQIPGQPSPKIHIEPNNPWIAQEWVEGFSFCSYSVCNNGAVQAHTAYPVGYSADGKGCIIFEAMEHLKSFQWIEKVVKATNFTGQIAFDFIESKEGKLFAIECNPRSTNGALLFRKNDCLERAFLNSTSSLICPLKGFKIQLLPGMLLYGWRKSARPNNTMRLFLKTLFGIKDCVFNRRDLLPFFAQPISMGEIWVNSLKSELSLPAFFVFDYEWNG